MITLFMTGGSVMEDIDTGDYEIFHENDENLVQAIKEKKDIQIFHRREEDTPFTYLGQPSGTFQQTAYTSYRHRNDATEEEEIHLIFILKKENIENKIIPMKHSGVGRYKKDVFEFIGKSQKDVDWDLPFYI